MSEIKIKTLEKLVFRELHGSDKNDRRLQDAFHAVFTHFCDEQYLHNTEHESIMNLIYRSGCYKHKSVQKLAQDFHLDYKTLLDYRKSYLRLFAKYYLGLPSSTNTEIYLLYTVLLKKENERKETAGRAKIT